MYAGVFQGALDFDRYDLVLYRTYLAIDDSGKVLLAHMPESRTPSFEEVKSFECCFEAEARFIGEESTIQFRRNEVVVTLVLRLDELGMHVVDPQEDEFGGWGGTYERVP